MTARLVILGCVLAALWSVPAATAQPRASLPDIEDEVMCVECGTALNISTSQVADRQRELIRRLIAQGRSKEQIKQALVAEFGPGVLALPEDDGFDLAVYVVPPLAIGLALAAVLLTARRWRRADAPEAGGEAPEPAPEQAARLERDMRAYDL